MTTTVAAMEVDVPPPLLPPPLPPPMEELIIYTEEEAKQITEAEQKVVVKFCDDGFFDKRRDLWIKFPSYIPAPIFQCVEHSDTCLNAPWGKHLEFFRCPVRINQCRMFLDDYLLTETLHGMDLSVLFKRRNYKFLLDTDDRMRTVVFIRTIWSQLCGHREANRYDPVTKVDLWKKKRWSVPFDTFAGFRCAVTIFDRFLGRVTTPRVIRKHIANVTGSKPLTMMRYGLAAAVLAYRAIDYEDVTGIMDSESDDVLVPVLDYGEAVKKKHPHLASHSYYHTWKGSRTRVVERTDDTYHKMHQQMYQIFRANNCFIPTTGPMDILFFMLPLVGDHMRAAGFDDAPLTATNSLARLSLTYDALLICGIVSHFRESVVLAALLAREFHEQYPIDDSTALMMALHKLYTASPEEILYCLEIITKFYLEIEQKYKFDAAKGDIVIQYANHVFNTEPVPSLSFPPPPPPRPPPPLSIPLSPCQSSRYPPPPTPVLPLPLAQQ